MEDAEKASLFYYLASISTSLAKITGDKKYAEETKKTASRILDTVLKGLEND